MEPVVHLYFKEIFPFFLLLGRVGGVLLTAPALGDAYIPLQIRCFLSLAVCLALTPALASHVGESPPSFLGLMGTMGLEVSIGLFTGLTLRLLFSALHMAGSLIGYQIGLINAFVSDPTFGEQVPLPAVFMSLVVSFLIFATDIHHHIFRCILESYQVLPPRSLPSLENFLGETRTILEETLKASFRIGLQLAGPFIALGLIFQVGLGILNRLLPQIQVFFIAQPLILFLGFLIWIFVTPSLFMLFMKTFEGLTQMLWTFPGS